MSFRRPFPSISATRPLLLLLALCAGGTAAAQELDAIIAVVGEEVVLSSELEVTLQQVEQQWRAQQREVPSREALSRQVLDRLVLIKLQLQRARSAGIQASEEDLQQALAGIAARNSMTLNEFADAVARDGVDYAGLREQVRNELLITRLRQREVDARVSVSDAEVDLYLEGRGAGGDDREYRLRHILIETPEGASAEQLQQARSRAEEVLARVAKGEDFAQLALAYSQDDQALAGGEIGWRSAAALPSLFAAVVPGMKPGAVSPVITSPSGLHILKLEEVRRAGTGAVSETHARHILLTANAIRDAAATQAEAERLRRELDKGADFADLARRHSNDPGSAQQGGDLGWQQAGGFVPEFQTELEAMQPGDIRGPFSSRFGWHIVQLLDRRQRDPGNDPVRDKARTAIFQRKAAEEYELWLRRLRDEAYVELRLPAQDDG